MCKNEYVKHVITDESSVLTTIDVGAVLSLLEDAKKLVESQYIIGSALVSVYRNGVKIFSMPSLEV